MVVRWVVACVGVVFVVGTFALKDVHIYIPTAVIRGHSAILRCHYDLEGDQLYAVKWYKGRREFYRFTPKEQPPVKTFPIAGLSVRKDFSNNTHLALENLQTENSGEYSCEISADAPSFFTRIVTGSLSVVDLPDEDPSINGLKIRYRLGDVLDANCTSGASHPPANLTWYVNGRRLDDDTQHLHRHRAHARDSPANTYASLRLQITKQLFPKRRLKVRCVASIHDVYYRSSEKSVELEKKHHRHRYGYPPQPEVAARDSPGEPRVIWEYETQAVQRQSNFSLTFTPLSGGGGRWRGVEAVVGVCVWAVAAVRR